MQACNMPKEGNHDLGIGTCSPPPSPHRTVLLELAGLTAENTHRESERQLEWDEERRRSKTAREPPREEEARIVQLSPNCDIGLLALALLGVDMLEQNGA